MASETVEDYLRAILLLQEDIKDESYVQMNNLANSLGVTPGSATVMVQNLALTGHVEYRKRVGSRLTPRGEAEAVQVLRRHRLVELFLVDALGLDWSEVHEEAHRLEHCLSDRVLASIDAYLGHPAVDPHGDPIPRADGGVAARSYGSLADARHSAPVRIVRVVDQAPHTLRFLEAKGLRLGSTVVVEGGDEVSGALTVRPEGQPSVALGWAAARNILVEPA